MSGVVEVRANIYAESVSLTASESPELWNALLGASDANLQGLSISSEDDAQNSGRPPEWRTVRRSDGRIIIDVSPRQPVLWPSLSVVQPVLLGGQRLGSVEVTRSFRTQALLGVVVTLSSLLLGALLLWALRVVPLKLLREALEREAFMAGHDVLTGLPNRALCADRLEVALANARRSGTLVAVLCIDLDHFKSVNDTLGHAAGDILLRTVAARLIGCLREVDTVARLGGDEFAVILTSAHQASDVERVATRLVGTARDPIDVEGHAMFSGLSVGIALNTSSSDGVELMKQADVALYQAKDAGRGGYRIFAPEMNTRLLYRRALENDLRAAFAAQELFLHYQPLIDLGSGRIIGAEALMRWTRRGETPVSPGSFIPIAEETGLIGALGEWLLNEACREATGWPSPMCLAVNVSPVQFRHGDFVDMVRRALAATGFPANRLELEVTEGILLHDTKETLEILDQLRCIGVRLVMDDFGTGYASLGYLQKFQFDKIKIDKSFIQNLGTDPNAVAIVRAVVGMSAALGICSNAEGVEKVEQAELLRAHGCNEVQGFHYWAPMLGVDLRKIIAA